MMIGESFKVNDELQASRWMHNSMTRAKELGLVPWVEQAVGFGRGWVDGDKVIAEVKATQGARGDEWLSYVREGGKMVRYSQGFSMPKDDAVKRDDGVTELHNVTCWEMSPVPDPAAPGTMTLAAALGMGVGSGDNLRDVVRAEVQKYLESSEFLDSVKDGVRWGTGQRISEIANRETLAALDDAGVKSQLTLMRIAAEVGL